ncbi:hypothetical protein KY290_033506 [Solanum tuberosum]|uniref:Uncharacterized protein n=1 Tax=Solanum tuberosum TaxID=4113 RepID=A0ABQ7U2A5_SOLTU|nr:hypothetical protein KY289_032864 [Solanum tuberosum]KAH0649248.1 hypothetical protein KY285_034496 [Solanum tuberosum]KAH0740463.1 hypothetical protein KY290_033506 [Solanum tuberosum]
MHYNKMYDLEKKVNGRLNSKLVQDLSSPNEIIYSKLTGIAFTWYVEQDFDKWLTWEDMSRDFVEQYKFNIKDDPTILDLLEPTEKLEVPCWIDILAVVVADLLVVSWSIVVLVARSRFSPLDCRYRWSWHYYCSFLRSRQRLGGRAGGGRSSGACRGREEMRRKRCGASVLPKGE